jgi:MoxR-like ATPase
MTLERRITPSEVVAMRELILGCVHVDDRIREYIVRLGRATRDPADAGRPALREMIALGISPRSYQHILALARVNAFIEKRAYVLPGDVKEILVEAARHRIVRSIRAQADDVSTDSLLEDIMSVVPIP